MPFRFRLPLLPDRSAECGAAKTGRAVNIKKGRFYRRATFLHVRCYMARPVLYRYREITERAGTTFAIVFWICSRTSVASPK